MDSTIYHETGYSRFTYKTKYKQQESFRLGNRFSLRCFGPWTKHLPPIYWATLRCMFLKWPLICKRNIVERNSLLIKCIILAFAHYPRFAICFTPKCFILKKMIYQVLCTVIFLRRSLETFVSFSIIIYWQIVLTNYLLLQFTYLSHPTS